MTQQWLKAKQLDDIFGDLAYANVEIRSANYKRAAARLASILRTLANAVETTYADYCHSSCCSGETNLTGLDMKGRFFHDLQGAFDEAGIQYSAWDLEKSNYLKPYLNVMTDAAFVIQTNKKKTK